MVGRTSCVRGSGMMMSPGWCLKESKRSVLERATCKSNYSDGVGGGGIMEVKLLCVIICNFIFQCVMFRAYVYMCACVCACPIPPLSDILFRAADCMCNSVHLRQPVSDYLLYLVFHEQTHC